MPFKIGYREASEAERSALWEAIIASIAVTASISATMPDKGAWLSAALGTGIAAIKLFESKIKKSKRLCAVDKQLQYQLIPKPMKEEHISLIVDSIKKYLSGAKEQEEQLSRYYTQNLEVEFAELLFKKCWCVLEKQLYNEELKGTQSLLKQFCADFSPILLDREIVIQFTDLEQIVSDTMESARATNREVKEHETVLTEHTGALNQLCNPYTRFVENNQINPDPKSSMFSFLNPAIQFQGRENELDSLKKWISEDGFSFWAITGQGGCGKSRLAFQLGYKNREKYKTVWLNDVLIDKLFDLLALGDCSYPQPVLFIFDYAGQYSEKIVDLVKELSKIRGDADKGVNAKILLLERSSEWYVDFINKNASIHTLRYRDDPIDLDNSVLDDGKDGYKRYNNIMDDISREYYESKEIPTEKRLEIIQKAKILSSKNGPGKNDSVRCLFLILTANAYLRGEPIRSMNTEKLVDIYIARSQEKLTNQYGEKTADIGYLVLAFVTACGGIQWEERPPAIQDKLDYIFKIICSGKKDKKKLFFSQLSESECKDKILPLKPDLIGEYLFLKEWDNYDIKDEKDKWLPNLLELDYGKEFLARCLTNWHNAKSERLCEEIKSIGKQQENGLEKSCAEVFGKAFHESNSDEEQKKFFDIIKAFSKCISLPFISQHAQTILYMIKNAHKKNGYNSEYFPPWELEPETKEDS